MTLRIAGLRASFHCEFGGVVRDVRAFPGDELIPDRVVLWIESPAPPPIDGASGVAGSFQTAAAAAENGEVAFRLPHELLRTRTPVVQRVLTGVGQKAARGTPLLEVALGALRFEWPSPSEGAVVEVLVRPGEALVDGMPVLRFDGKKRRPGRATQPSIDTVVPLRRREIPDLTLAEFRRTTAALSERMAAMASLVAEAGLANSAELLKAEMSKLSDSRFTVAVVGEFKRGKSTFLNALAGTEFLPNDVIPCTAFACRFQYAEQVELAIVGSDGVESRSPQRSVPEIVAELNRLTRDPQTSIREAIIRLPLNLCRDGVDLIDTPGLNDSEAMNQVTLSVLPNVDAAVLLLIPESPVSETERRFLEDHLLTRDIGRILFVLTAKDRVAAPQLPRLVDYIQGQIHRILAGRAGSDASESALLCISSRKELDHPGDSDTGFPELRREMNRLLFRQRGRLLLMQALQRIRRAVSESLSTVKLRIAQLATTRESFQASLQEIDRQLELIRLHANGIRRRLAQAQIETERAAAAQAGQLHLALLALRESLPQEVSMEQLKRGAEAIKIELGSAFQQNAGKLYQQFLTALLEQVRVIYEPAAHAERVFVEQAESAFDARASNLYQDANAARSAKSSRATASLEMADTLNFNGGFIIRIDLSLGALSWLYLAESANSLLAGGELASSIESRALAKLRQNYGQEIERQVRAKSSEAVLNLKFAEFARRPFNDLMRRFDQEVKILLNDSVAALASLRAASVPGGDAGHDWEAVHRRIESVAEECERIVFSDRTESLQAAS